MSEAALEGVLRARSDRLSALERWALAGVLGCAGAGAGVAGYLVALHQRIAGNPNRGLCTFTDTISCDKVLASSYAAIGPIPVALIGLTGFVLLFGMALWRLAGGLRTPRRLPALLAAVAGLGLAFELVMTWIEFFVIRAVCPYCLVALACIAGTFAAATVAWWAAVRADSPEGFNSRR
jgi:uncharacterized membrane protein